MTTGLLTDLTIFALAVMVGFEVISKVPSILHTPLMSGANAIHGIVLVGAMVITADVHTDYGCILGGFAMLFAAMNVVGGYVVTDRMLHMFKRRPETAPASVASKETEEVAGR